MTRACDHPRAWSNDRIELVHRIGRICRRDWYWTDSELGLVFPEQDMTHALEVLRDLSQLLIAHGALHYVCDGTLLGIVREDRFIPGDNDIDFRVERKALNGDLEESLKAKGFTIFKRSFVEGRVVNIGLNRDGIAVDFYGADFEQDTTSFEFIFKQAVLSYREPFEGVKLMSFHGVPVAVPENPEANLRFVYGEGWQHCPAKWDDLFSHGALFRCTGRYRFLRAAYLRFEAARLDLSTDMEAKLSHDSWFHRELSILKQVSWT